MKSPQLLKQGAEARLYRTTFCGRPAIVKERFKKTYRHPELDDAITNDRIKAEARALVRCCKLGVRAPVVYQVDLPRRRIVMQDLPECSTVREAICRLSAAQGADCEPLLALAGRLGRLLATLHAAGLVHGDLTTSNLLVDDQLEHITVIDFGLSVADGGAEELAVDLYVLERAVLSTHPQSGPFTEHVYTAYEQQWSGARAVLDKLHQVRMRGRKRLMLG
ncbi:EKC/KEOPS complex subunit Tp53rk [Amphibalanus amphitrite]|uniref:non-specific serine/threonine protein kinase n=1 Tax=Amphibalanus amphitrite TaxID=1232801 RepID=A0A6A4WDE9_AMPAM|nr:EKC/KEOPS complex subunit Tp53rk-like [Amphibalanus amphitrite]XP_043234301.1 EKC/KEOPS complex subunit Tp53rk-like [Amphibalanus amphitrite]XP_043234302.1 EKC/KEOPS complex subunit Tp53rk-like [Amphibalanus amphitrite]XP_043234303.1 EKC/KEOPS complex subunit Tp53rk-like [Amphibalanus amphitrite]KAF0304675.1 EKC/KEOPS complex subunit Tp53rk [Amphibalanus amphitrite]